MAKLRKMLGDINDPVIIELMHTIETQSKETLGKWAVEYVKQNYLPIYEEVSEGDTSFHQIISEIELFLIHERKLAEIKPFLKEAREIAKKSGDDPIKQAAARAISTACAVVQTPTNALGFTFYGAALVAYHTLGVNAKENMYDEVAEKEFNTILNSILKVAVTDEKNPAKIKWGC